MLRTTIIAALVLTATPADAAEPVAGALSVRVPTADLDLSRDTGVATLDKRIRAAAQVVCPYRSSADLWTLMTHRACVRSAHRSAAKARNAVIAQSRLGAAEVANAAR